MNYSDLTDEEINRLVAEVIEPGMPSVQEFPFDDDDSWPPPALSAKKGWVLCAPTATCAVIPRNFCNDPAAWGWLLERERISAIFNDLTLPPRWDGAAPTPGGERPYIGMAEKPGRAVAIAFLESKEVR